MDKSVSVYESQVLDQVAMMEETTSAVTEMISSIANLSKIATNRKEGTLTLSDKISEGDLKIRESFSSVQDIHGDVDTMEQLNTQSHQVKKESNELKAVNGKIVDAMAHMSRISLSIDNSIREINKGMSGISRGMEDMNTLSANLDSTMTDAKQQLNRFRLSENTGFPHDTEGNSNVFSFKKKRTCLQA